MRLIPLPIQGAFYIHLSVVLIRNYRKSRQRYVRLSSTIPLRYPLLDTNLVILQTRMHI
jgi:hypothetical protein